jgi:hypothetical protein
MNIAPTLLPPSCSSVTAYLALYRKRNEFPSLQDSAQQNKQKAR